MGNILKLHQDLVFGDYCHSAYSPFKVADPKPRNIHKALVRDRLFHRAIYRVLYPMFDKTFIFDSYSCRNKKGTHKAFERLVSLTRKISKNYTQPCYALKLDIKKFFDSVDHAILMGLMKEMMKDERLLNLLCKIIHSFEYSLGKGMPLGNLTSQLFANVYLDPLDKFAKHKLKVKHYLRYADDIVFLFSNPDELMGYLVEVNQFLKTRLKLNIHPNKIHLKKLNWGIDYVGYVVLPHYSIPRKKTVKRIFKKVTKLLKRGNLEELAKAAPSYLGYLKHVNAHNLSNLLVKYLFKSIK